MRRLVALLGLAVMIALPAAAQTDRDPLPPRAVVDRLQESLEQTLREAEALGVQGRFEQLRAPVAAAYDIEVMIKTIVGRHWRAASEAQRQDLARAFGDFTVALYASRLKSYSGQTFMTFGAVEGPRGTRLVPARILRPRKEAVDLTYVLRKNGQRWGIVDVITGGGISELATRRSEFAATLRRGGVAALITALRAKVNTLLTA